MTLKCLFIMFNQCFCQILFRFAKKLSFRHLENFPARYLNVLTRQFLDILQMSFGPLSQGMYTYDIHENCLILKSPYFLCLPTSKIPPPPHSLTDFGRSILNKPLSPTLPNTTMKQQPHRACEQKKSKQNKKITPSNVIFKLITHSIVPFSSQTMHWQH